MNKSRCYKAVAIIIGFVLVNSACIRRLPVKETCHWEQLQQDESINDYHSIFGKIYWGNLTHKKSFVGLPAMEMADLQTFHVCVMGNYAKDKNHVYYPIHQWNFEGEYDGGVFADVWVVDKADPKTFQYIGNEFGADKKRMYYMGRPIKWDNEVIRSKGRETSDMHFRNDIYGGVDTIFNVKFLDDDSEWPLFKLISSE